MIDNDTLDAVRGLGALDERQLAEGPEDLR
jgi:hypothetical protein